MIISHKYKFVFRKTQKTAGSTIEKILRPLLGENDICTGSKRDNTPPLNLPYGLSGHKAKPIPNGYWSFAIERNPWDKMVSMYYWKKYNKPDRYSQLSFTKFIEREQLHSDWHMYQDVDKIYQYENLKEILVDLNDKYNFNIDLDLLNTIKCKSDIREVNDYKELYTSTTKEIIEKTFRKEIEKFNYTY